MFAQAMHSMLLIYKLKDNGEVRCVFFSFMENSPQQTSGNGEMTIISVEDRISVTQRNIVNFVIVLAIMLLEQKHYAHQCRQFVTAAAICVDKTL